MTEIRTNLDAITPLPRTPPHLTYSAETLGSLQAQAEAFYSWYLSIRQDTFPQEGFRNLQCIMQIGEKETATPEESINALEKLSFLIEELDGGKKTLDQIPGEIQNILNDLVQNNFQSRIRMQLTRIEIAINSVQSPFSAQQIELYKHLLQKIKPEMSRIQALEISRLLERLNAPSHSTLNGKSFSQLN